MTEGSIFMSITAGVLFGWASAYSAEENRLIRPQILRHEFVGFLIFIIAALTVIYSGINTGSFLNALFALLVILFTGFCFNFMTSRRIDKKLSGHRHHTQNHQRSSDKQQTLDSYSKKLLTLSTQACGETMSSIDIDTSSHGDRWLMEIIAYSLFITSLHCQRERLTDTQISSVLSSLLAHIAIDIAEIGGNDILDEQKVLSDAYDHFHACHVTRKGDASELIQSIVISLISEYETSKSNDFKAMTQVYQALSSLAKDLNSTGFARAQKH